MDSYDVVIAGGGPAGSSCAWGLRKSGLRVAIVDRQAFPRNKVCGGWITPAVLEELRIDPGEYAQGRVFQSITGFRTSWIGGREVETHYGKPVSYGIRRLEFDDYLLKRCGARVMQGTAEVERSGGEWIIDGRMRARMLVGAGGTFCPVARRLGAKVNSETVVAAQEVEYEVDATCPVRGEIPELYFCADMKGYGWLFRKQGVLNVGLGRLDRHELSSHAAEFLRFLKLTGRVSAPPALVGHAYLLYGFSAREPVGDGVLLVGDAAGLAYSVSGEGIRPAIESGLLAAEAIEAAGGRYERERLEPYRELLRQRFGKDGGGLLAQIGGMLPAGLASAAARRLLSTHWFARDVVLGGWFLRSHETALSAAWRRDSRTT